MKILHTSDWHLGRSLYGRKRYDEFEKFLIWLAQTIETEKIDALLIAGDIFDTGTPSNRAQELYYKFLCNVAGSCCRHIVVIAGNHDSPSFLNAPKELLRFLNVYVIGAVSENIEDELVILKDKNNKPISIICAVPYLRDRDIRTVEAGESFQDKHLKLIEGIKNHYSEIINLAEQKRKELQSAGPHSQTNIPIIAMGHLFAAGGKTLDGDGVRELYVGSLAHIGVNIFPDSVDYVALGHLHVPQKVDHRDDIRYSGSPIPMGFGEAKQKKIAVIIDYDVCDKVINEINIPCFQPLERITGGSNKIKSRIEELKSECSNAWLEIEYTGSDIIGSLREQIDEMLSGTSMEVRRIKNRLIMDRVLNSSKENETLDDLDEKDVFERCLEINEVPEESRGILRESYNEIIRSFHEEDTNAE